MFTPGQIKFAIFFIVVFVITAVLVYRKDKGLHKMHYKGSYKVLIGFLLFIAFLFVVKIFLKH